MGRRLIAGIAAGALLLTGAACSDDDGDDDATETTTTEVAEETTTEVADEGSTTSEPDDDEPTTTVEDLTNDVIRQHLEDEHPDAAALVDWAIFRWVSGFGYTATVPEGTGYDEAVAVCTGLAEIVDEHSELDAIAVVAGPDEAPLAAREGPDGTCAPAA